MIYLICAQDSKNRLVEIHSKADSKSHFYKYVSGITSHRNILYPYEFYRDVIDCNILPNRVNIIFTRDRKQKTIITNAITANSVREIVSVYGNNVDDVYIIASTKQMVDYFGNRADYLIVYETDELGHTVLNLTDSINFANYNKLKTEAFGKHKIHYFVVNPDNYLGN